MSADAQEARPARRGRGRPRGQDSAVVREDALRAAIDLIARQGYAATSMAQVADLVDLAYLNMERRQLVLLYISVVGEAATPDHPAHDWMLRHYEGSREVLVQGLRADQHSGHVRPDAPVDRIARSIIALMDGLQLQWLLDAEFDMGAALAGHVEEVKRAWSTDQG